MLSKDEEPCRVVVARFPVVARFIELCLVNQASTIRFIEHLTTILFDKSDDYNSILSDESDDYSSILSDESDDYIITTCSPSISCSRSIYRALPGESGIYNETLAVGRHSLDNRTIRR